jgi:hypothetical protein
VVKLSKNKFLVGILEPIAYAVDTLIESADQLKNDDSIALALVGGGKEKSVLKALVNAKDLNNVIFIDPIPKIETKLCWNISMFVIWV